jgi:hypothetical protein
VKYAAKGEKVLNKNRIVSYANSILRPLGVELIRPGWAYDIDPSSSFMKDSKLREELVEQLSTIAEKCFSTTLKLNSHQSVNYTSEVRNFLSCYSDRPFRDNWGGSGFHNSFWLFLAARILNPTLIVESGLWKGHTTWLLEQAAPEAEILGFDISLSRLEHKSGKARFFEYDWSNYQFEDIYPDRSMIFFDCHVNHAKRIIEAKNRGFRHLFFDDNPPVYALYGYRLPGFPTANMLWTGIEENSTNEIAWYWQGEEVVYKINGEEAAKAKEIMKVHEVLPNVGDFSRYGGFSYLAYVGI